MLRQVLTSPVVPDESVYLHLPDLEDAQELFQPSEREVNTSQALPGQKYGKGP